MEHEHRTFQTDYVVWANYDVAGNAQQSDQVDTCSAYLGALAMSEIGAPLSDFQRASLGASLDMPSVSLMGYLAPDGSWQEPVEGAPSYETWRDMAVVTQKEFGSRVS